MTETLSIAINKWSHDVMNEKCMRYLYAPNGTLIKPGEMMKNPELSATLEIIANANSSKPF